MNHNATLKLGTSTYFRKQKYFGSRPNRLINLLQRALELQKCFKLQPRLFFQSCRRVQKDSCTVAIRLANTASRLVSSSLLYLRQTRFCSFMTSFCLISNFCYGGCLAINKLSHICNNMSERNTKTREQEKQY